MKARLALLVVALFAFVAKHVSAQGTPIPPRCAQSIYIAKFSPRSVTVSNGLPTTIPVGVLPFVSWSTDSDCGQPTAASLHLQLLVASGGVTNILSAPDAPLPAPKTPGPQPFSGPVNLVVPDGLIPTNNLPQLCTVQGTYTVTFGAGIGNSTLTASGDVQVAISPRILELSQSSVDRLGIEFLPVDKKGTELFQVGRAGDQINSFFAIHNNDPINSVTLNITARTHQTAGLPLGFDPLGAWDDGVYAVGNREPGTGAFNVGFGDALAIGTLLNAIENNASSDIITAPRVVNLNPLESTIIPVTTRIPYSILTYSCNEVNVVAEGTFLDATPAITAAGTVLLTLNVAPRIPGIEFTDILSVAANREAAFTPASYYSGSTLLTGVETFAEGNLPPSKGEFQRFHYLVGNELEPYNTQGFPATASDWTRSPSEVGTIAYGVYNYINAPMDPTTVYNMVTIQNANAIGKKALRLPTILPNPPRGSNTFFDVFYNVSANDIVVQEGAQTHYSGNYTDFLKRADLRPTLSYDLATSRSFGRVGSLQDQRFMDVRPLGYAFNLKQGGAAVTSDFQVAFSPFKVDATWGASLKLTGVSLLTKKGFHDQDIRVRAVPFLGDIPVAGSLFKNNMSVKSKDSLVIFITPVLVRTSRN